MLGPHPRYLALDEIYHLLWAATPNNPTRQLYNTVEIKIEIKYGILTLFDIIFQKIYIPTIIPVIYNRKTTIRA
jgi:hypothetical protein